MSGGSEAPSGGQDSVGQFFAFWQTIPDLMTSRYGDGKIYLLFPENQCNDSLNLLYRKQILHTHSLNVPPSPPSLIT